MSDSTFDASLIGGEPSDPIVVDKRGTLMREGESYERVIEGLKMAADGARHLTRLRGDESWRLLGDLFDSLRKAISQLGGMTSQVRDAVETRSLSGASTLGVHASYDRVYRGLDMAAKGARQVAVCHRGDLRWSLHARKFEILRDKCSELIRKRRNEGSRLLLTGVA